MTGFLKLISAIIWVLDYVRQNPKKSVVGATGLAGVTTAAMFYGAPGVPTNPPGLTVGGTPSDGDVVTYVDPTGPEWAAGGGGSGITYDGTVTDGQIPVYDDSTNEYVPTQAGTQVQDVTAFITATVNGSPMGIRAGGSALQTTGSITSGTDQLTVAAGWDGARGHGVQIIGAGADHGLDTPGAPTVIPQTQVAEYPYPQSLTRNTAVSWTTATATDRLTPAGGAELNVADGTGVKFSNQGGTLPTYTGPTAFVEGTEYFVRNNVEVKTIILSGSPSAGTYIINVPAYGPYPAQSVEVAYNANSATVQAALRTLWGFDSITIVESGTTPNFTHTITFTGVLWDVPDFSTTATKMTGGSIAHNTTTQGGLSLHDTSAHAIAGTDTYDIVGTGTGTHYIDVQGTTSVEHDVIALSGGGGYTVDGADGTTTVGHATRDKVTSHFIVWDAVTGANGYVVYGDSTTDGNRRAAYMVHSVTSCLKIQMDAAGYTQPEIGDIGRTLVQGTHDGRILAIDWANRIFYVEPTVFGTDTFPTAAGSFTITGGTGAGVQTSAATSAVYVRDVGAAANDVPYKKLNRRNSAIVWVGEVCIEDGVFWTCVLSQDANLTDSSAPVSMTSAAALGTLVVDGDITWRRQNMSFPPSRPSAEAFDALATSIEAVSGTTVTLAHNATTTVASQYVFHDDLTAIQAHWDACRSLTSRTDTLYFPGNREYPLMPGKIVSGDSRWGSPTGGGSNSYALFNFYHSSGTKVLKREWLFGDTARIWWSGFDTGGGMNATSNRTLTLFWRFSHSAPTWTKGSLIFSSLGEPVMEHWDGEDDSAMWANNSSASTINIQGPIVTKGEFIGQPRGWTSQGTRGVGQAEIIRDTYMQCGGNGHNGCFYTKGGLYENVTAIGMRAYYSTLFYQDTNDITQPLEVRGGFYKNWRKDGFRIREGGFKCIGATVRNIGRFYGSGGGYTGYQVINCDIEDTDINPTQFDAVLIENCRLKNVSIIIASGNDGVKISNVESITSTVRYPLVTTAISLLSISGGSDISVSNSNFTVGMTRASGPDHYGLLVSGGSDEITLTGSKFGSHALGVSVTGFTGSLQTTACRFYGIGQPSVTFGLAATADWTSTNDIFESWTTNNIQVSGGRRIKIVNPTLITGFWSVTSAVTGPMSIVGGNSPGGTIAEPSTVIDGHNFAAAPTLSGATLFTSGNSVADNKVATPSALGTTSNDLALGVQDTHRLDPNAANTVLSSIVARAGGTTVTIICVDAGAATLTLLDDDGATGTAANRIVTPDGADIVLSNNETVVLQYDATAQRWKVIGGGYTSIWNRDAQRAFEGSLALAA